MGQDTQYIHHLEIVSRTNLLYVEKYNKYSKKFKEVFDNDDKFAESMIKQLNALENSLELQGASTGLDSVSKASKDTAKSLTAVSDATQEVERHFSALEIVGITVMMRLTNAALTYGSRMANNLWSKTLGQVIF